MHCEKLSIVVSAEKTSVARNDHCVVNDGSSTVEGVCTGGSEMVVDVAFFSDVMKLPGVEGVVITVVLEAGTTADGDGDGDVVAAVLAGV